MRQQRRTKHEPYGQRGDAGHHHHQPVRRLSSPGSEMVLEPAGRKRPLRCPRHTRFAPREEEFADPDQVAKQRDRKQEDA
jgi:hypothetical protein